jgi:hypothetical protein
MDKKVAIYHFTDAEVLRRPRVNEKQMERLEAFSSQFGLIEDIYLDKTLKREKQVEKDKLIENISNYDVLCMKDFYHLSKNTGTCIGLLQKFAKKGVVTKTIEDGEFSFELMDIPFDKELKVCIYHSKYKEDVDRTVNTQLEIFNLFIKTHTNWKIEDTFVDNENSQSDTVQKEVFKVIANRDKYDLVVVKDFNCFHWRTAKFCKRRNELKLPIYSLKEGYLPY